jgi:hypothetical protein
VLNRPELEAQAVQIVVTDLDVLERRFRVVIFDEIMLDAALFRRRKNPLEINGLLPTSASRPLNSTEPVAPA